MENTTISYNNKTFTVPTPWVKWAIESVINYEALQASGNEEAWEAFVESCPIPEDLEKELYEILMEAEFDIVSAC
jgi:hypothetical protein